MKPHLFSETPEKAALAQDVLARLSRLSSVSLNDVSGPDLAAQTARIAESLRARALSEQELVDVSDTNAVQSLAATLAVWLCGATPVTGGQVGLRVEGDQISQSDVPSMRLDAGLVTYETLVGAVAHPLATLGRLPLPETLPGAVAILADWRTDAWLPLAIRALIGGAKRVTIANDPADLTPASGTLLAAPIAALASYGVSDWERIVTWGAGKVVRSDTRHQHGFGDHFVLAITGGDACRGHVLGRHRVLNASGRPLPENAWGQLGLAGVLPEWAETIKDLKLPQDRRWQTDYRARHRADGHVEFDGADLDRWRHAGRRLSPGLVERALAGAGLGGSVAICRDDGTDRARMVVFGNAPCDKAALQAVLPRWADPIGYVILPSFPRLDDGGVDVETLLETAPPDDWLLRHCAARLTQDKDRPVHIEPRVEIRELPGLPLPEALTVSGPVYPASRKSIVHGPELAPSTDTLIDRLQRAAETDRGLVLIDKTGASQDVPYRKLLEEASKLAGFLRRSGLKPGDELIVHCDAARDLFTGIWASILTGVLPVPLTPPDPYDVAGNPLWHLLGPETMLKGRTVLTSRQHARRMRAALQARDLSADILCIEEAADAAPLSGKDFTPDRNALMLLTSGSTGAPKGVVLTHANLVSLSRAVGEAYDFGACETSLNWLAIDHVGGLVQHHMRDLCRANHQIHVDTYHILSDPVRLLDLIDRYRVSLLWMANFGFNMLNEKATEIRAGSWDLSCVKMWENGGEAVSHEGNQRFLSLLLPHGLPANVIKPVFGMTETTSACIGAHNLVAGRQDYVHWLGDASLDAAVKRGLPGESTPFVEVGVP
ncbi:MAG: AMP-binding protein, partial [Pseudomonadota bacterium]